jgi:hypothetical protein
MATVDSAIPPQSNPVSIAIVGAETPQIAWFSDMIAEKTLLFLGLFEMFKHQILGQTW